MSLCLQPIDLKKFGWQTTTSQDETIAEGYTCGEGNLSTPLSKLTKVDINGDGVFDVLMRAVKTHLREEYDQGRIVGKDYTTVYLGSITQVLQTSIQFMLNQQQANQISAEIGLIHQKIVTELAETDDSIPVGLGFNHIPVEGVTCIGPVTCSILPTLPEDPTDPVPPEEGV
jgi:hypothetical protein